MSIPGNIEAILHLWDISGQSIESEMLQNYVSGCQVNTMVTNFLAPIEGVLFVFDIHEPNSFEQLDLWFSRVQDCLMLEGGKRWPTFALVANKMDLQYQTTLERQTVEKFAQRNGLSVHFVSAKTGEGVHRCFLGVACTVLGVQVRTRDCEMNQPVIEASLMVNHRATHTSKRAVTPSINEQNISYEHTSSVCQML
ncbi:hypothetical protein D915_003406 [Fasciola hepatica]|uniref:Ras family protein n=1 Tax=Fasciola hepatica TaxID=6192 RepID=A0A4E0S0L0_FASHE|nr:hypothetical protein D915_003406 [Fasciola hepatica]